MKCAICERDSTRKGYCELHARAYRNILKEYQNWRKALKIPWKEYLSEIAENSFTGQWAKEVARSLKEKDSESDLKSV